MFAADGSGEVGRGEEIGLGMSENPGNFTAGAADHCGGRIPVRSAIHQVIASFEHSS